MRKKGGAIFVAGGGLFFLGAMFGWPGIMIIGLILMVGMFGLLLPVTNKDIKGGGGSDGPLGPGGFGGYD